MKGFTIVELLVVVAISVMLGTVALVYSNTAKNQVALSVETTKIAQFIIRAKDLALATYNDTPGTCGYGVEVDAVGQTYSIFAYQPPGAPPCPDASSVNTVPPPTRNHQVSVGTWNVPLARGVRINSLADSLVWVLFYPPAPKTFLSRSNGANTTALTSYVHLATVDGSGSSIISVNPAGQVNF